MSSWFCLSSSGRAWNISYAQANPDGLFERRVITVNGTWPPPPIEMNQNDTSVLHVYNGLGDVATAIHHHGMFLRNHSYFDGAVGISQCPIPPGYSFDYTIPTDMQIGTYWVHGHAFGQYVDGLRAPFIIHNPTESYTYDAEFTVIIADWYHTEHSILLGQFLNIANPTGAEPVPDSGLIYFTQNGEYLPGFNDNATLPFEAGKTYRLRVINMSALAMFWFWIDGHQLQIIEADGVDVEAAPIDIQSISVAQRYSFLVKARNDTNANWLIHANMDITYAASASIDPGTTMDYVNTIDDHLLVPLLAQPIGVANQTVPLNAFFATYSDGFNHASFQNITFNTPLTPTYLSATSSGSMDPAWYGPSASVLQYGNVIELMVVNWDIGLHPFHLHGHKFAIVWKSFDVTSNDPTINPPVPGYSATPMWRDTEMVPPGGAVRLRFVADNPGAWFFHCHIDWHLSSGLAWALIEAPDVLYSTPTLQAAPAIYSQCAQGNFPTTGNAAGHNDSATDYSGWKLGPYPQQLGWHAKGIGAMFGCVLSAVLGMGAVVWYGATGIGSDI
ncbi:ferroxidase fet3 [Tulasnella sp. 330]|nr:ferroxidase fet3 [Tulasnella sp. 330]KAG8875835.1 ferroxidase fet3 [Tulasnella sp. 331]